MASNYLARVLDSAVLDQLPRQHFGVKNRLVEDATLATFRNQLRVPPILLKSPWLGLFLPNPFVSARDQNMHV